MKAVVRKDGMEMTVQSRGMGQPTIKGELWDAIGMVPIPLQLLMYDRVEAAPWPEIDLVLAMMDDPMAEVEWIEPIDGFDAPEGAVA